MIYIQPPDFHHFNFYSPDYLSICIYSLFSASASLHSFHLLYLSPSCILLSTMI